MSELLARVRAYFVEVEDGVPPRPRRSRTPPDTVALVAPPKVAAAAGAALALELVREHRASCALLCAWEPNAGGAPAVRAAARAGAALRARGIEARAAGRLVRVALDEDTRLAAATLARAAAVVPGPAVLAVGRPRDEHIDRVLREQDAIGWIAPEGAGESLVAVLESSLAALGRTVVRCNAPSAVGRRLALAGVRSGTARAPAGASGTQTFGWAP
jgi:hypothetical protein